MEHTPCFGGKDNTMIMDKTINYVILVNGTLIPVAPQQPVFSGIVLPDHSHWYSFFVLTARSRSLCVNKFIVGTVIG